MKRRIFIAVLCLLFTIGVSSLAYAKAGGNGASGKSGGNGGSKATAQKSSPSASSPSASVDSASDESTEGQAQDGVENSGDTDQPDKNQLKKQDKVQDKTQARDNLRIRERVEAEVGEGIETEAGEGPKVKLKGKDVKFNVPPVIKEGRTLIPVRAIMNGLGAEVTWDEAAKTVTIVRDGVTVVVTLDSRVITVNGEEQEMDVPAQLISNSTFVPIRFVAQALNMNVDWDEETGTVDIGDGTETTTDETTTDETTTDETTTDETTTDETTTDETTTDETTDGDSTDTTTDQTGATDTTQQ